MTEMNRRILWARCGEVFTPGSPVSERDLFAGRQDQINRILEAVSQRGFHAVLYGDRGVGKTSLANVLSAFIQDMGKTVLMARANCDSTDSFSSLWRKIFREIIFTETREGIGFTASTEISTRRLIDDLPETLSPDDIRQILSQISVSSQVIVVIDEFDRLTDHAVPQLVSDTIKSLSDASVPATVILIGVADSVDQLIEGHRSIERSLVQVPMPRMSVNETDQIVVKGVERLEMGILEGAKNEISLLSQGLPYVTHMLSLYSARAAIDNGHTEISMNSVQTGIGKSIEQWQESIKTAYYEATRSHQPDHLYKEVLLSCALASVDEKSFFTAAAVRAPLQIIARPNLDIPNFARHLKEFSEERRGNILVREGETRRLRYRFISPLMRPYIIMRGVADGLLTQEMRDAISAIGTQPHF